MAMELPGHILLVMATGEAPAHVPSHLDYLLGAARPATSMRDRRLNAALDRGSDFIVTGTYHARNSLGLVGEQNHGFDDLEEHLGLSRTYSIRLGDATRTHDVVRHLAELPNVESARVQTLAVAPFALATAPVQARDGLPVGVDAWAPHDRIHAREAHQLEPGDGDVWVGLVDTGISLSHPEFRRKLLAGYDTVQLGMGGDLGALRLTGYSRGDDFVPRDEVGHGSHVGGIVGAHGWRLPLGLAGRSMLLPIRVLAAAIDAKTHKRVGVGGQSDINAGMKVALDLGADVLNLSFGTPASAVPEGPPPHREVVDYATHYGCTLVAAMGNSGRREEYFPAAFPEVIAVGSVDSDGQCSHFSTTGDHIALCAPGEGIVSAGRRGYESGSGTSYAAPFVTGAAALLLARARRRNRKLNGMEVRQLLTDSARPLGRAGFNSETGHGLLNVEAALHRLDQALSSPTPPGRAL